MALAKKWRQKLVYVAIAIAFSFVISIAIYFFIKSSDIYKSAATYAANSDEISTETGGIKAIYLMPFNLYIHTNGAEGKAKLQIYILGNKNSERVNLFLKQESGVWVVKSANAL